MHLSYSPLNHGIRLAYQKLAHPNDRKICGTLFSGMMFNRMKFNKGIMYKAVILAVPILLYTTMTHRAYANIDQNAALIVDDIVFSETGFDFTAFASNSLTSKPVNTQPAIHDSNSHDTVLQDSDSQDTGSSKVSLNDSIDKVSLNDSIDFSDNHQFIQSINNVDNRVINTESDKHHAINPADPVDVEDDAVRQSLERLAEFYEFNQTDLLPAQTNNDSLDHDIEHYDQHDKVGESTIINANSTAPVTLPKFYSKNQHVPRCEGVWVMPDTPTNYQNIADVDQGSNADSTLYAESDYAYYDNEDYVELMGDVKVVLGARLIESQRIVMDLRQGVTGAQGDVLFTDSALTDASNALTQAGNNAAISSGLIGVAGQLAYDSNNGNATAYDVAFASVPMQAHGYAKRLNRPNDRQIELDEVMFTTCPPNDRKWDIQAEKIDLDSDTGRAKAYNATFRLGDVPVLYLPYFNFPIDSRRSSGFLVPSASVDSENGMQIRVPYYFNLAPNYDATLTTQVFSNRNPMLTGDFRYLSKYGEGELVTSYLANDKQYNNDDRNAVFYQHKWMPDDIDHLSVGAIYNYVSDPDYINDFDRFGEIDNDLNLPRRVQVDYYNDYLSGQLKVETFQSLEAKDAQGNPILDKDKPYARLPQLSLTYRLPWVNTFDITGIHDSAYFKKSINDGSENEKSGVRIYNELTTSLPIQRSWGYVIPKAKLQHLFTTYDENSRIDNNLSKDDSSNGVFVPQFSIDAGLNLYQAGSPFGVYDKTMGGYQLLSPRLKYVYAPYKRQNDLPNFNTRIASINYEQLFEDSWLLGYDRISDNHAITPGINYSYIDAMGVTRFDASIAKQFIMDKGQVILDDNKPLLSDDTVGVVWRSNAQPYRNLWFNFDGALKSNDDLNYLTAGIGYQPTNNSLLNLQYVKRKLDEDTNQLPLSAWTASTILPINNRTRLMAQAQYNDKSYKIIDSLIGIDYEDCCYGMSIYGREYYNDLDLSDDPTRAIMFEFRINGLGRQSSRRLNRLATQKISGFKAVDDNWR